MDPMPVRFSRICVYSPRTPHRPSTHEKNPLYRWIPPFIRNWGKKVYELSVIRPLKLSSPASPLDRLCSVEPPIANRFNQGAVDCFQGEKRTLPMTSGSFVVPL